LDGLGEPLFGRAHVQKMRRSRRRHCEVAIQAANPKIEKNKTL
jgi:hypothetical protein